MHSTSLRPIQQLPKGFTISPYKSKRFFENDPNIIFHFSNLTFSQILEIKKFCKSSILVLFTNYGFNGETQKGSGTLKVSKLKIWTEAEQKAFEEIMGQSWENFNSFL